MQGGAIGRLSVRYSDAQLLLSASIGMTLGLVGWAYAASVLASALALAPLSLAIGIMSATLHSALSKSAHADDVGGILGIAAAIGSLTRAVGPALGGVLLDIVGAWGPGLLGAVFMAAVTVYSGKMLSRRVSTRGLERESSHI